MQTQTHAPQGPKAEVFALWRKVDELGLSTRDIVSEMLDGSIDFEVDNYRFIHENDIDEIQRNELESDPYMLGCFNAWFLADILGTDTDTIEAMQKAEAFEGLGKLIISQGLVDSLQSAYANADGYGHHFNHYDGCEDQIGDYYVFRTN